MCWALQGRARGQSPVLCEGSIVWGVYKCSVFEHPHRLLPKAETHAFELWALWAILSHNSKPLEPQWATLQMRIRRTHQSLYTVYIYWAGQYTSIYQPVQGIGLSNWLSIRHNERYMGWKFVRPPAACCNNIVYLSSHYAYLYIHYSIHWYNIDIHAIHMATTVNMLFNRNSRSWHTSLNFWINTLYL